MQEKRLRAKAKFDNFILLQRRHPRVQQQASDSCFVGRGLRDIQVGTARRQEERPFDKALLLLWQQLLLLTNSFTSQFVEEFILRFSLIFLPFFQNYLQSETFSIRLYFSFVQTLICTAPPSGKRNRGISLTLFQPLFPRWNQRSVY